jgi:hypothetical protein
MMTLAGGGLLGTAANVLGLRSDLGLSDTKGLAILTGATLLSVLGALHLALKEQHNSIWGAVSRRLATAGNDELQA